VIQDDTDRLLAGQALDLSSYDMRGTWRQPELLAEQTNSCPEFPLDALPSWLSRYCASVSEVVQTPHDLAGLLGLSVLAVASAKRCRVAVNSSWSEPLNLYAVAAMAASERKSPVYSKMTGPIRRHEAASQMLAAPHVAAAELERRVLAGRLAGAEKNAISGKTNRDRDLALGEAKLLADELARLPIVKSPRLLADDVTPERLAGLLSEQGGRMAVMSSEGDIFATISGRYSGGVGNYGVFLLGYSDPLLKVDRVTREGFSVPWPALTLALTVQPSVVAECAADSRMQSRGLLGRFLWAMPQSRVGFRAVRDNAPEIQGGRDYDEAITTMLNMAPDPHQDDDQNWRMMRLSEGARRLHLDLRREIEPRLAKHQDLSEIATWAGKLAGNTARIMGLIHLAKHIHNPEPWRLDISKATAEAACRIARWAIPHAEAALTPTIIQHSDALHVLEWLLEQPADVLTQTAIHKGARRRGWTVKDHLEPALGKLAERNWIRVADKPKGGRGRPSKRWAINPLARCPEAK
jgi:hypothetical protein